PGDDKKQQQLQALHNEIEDLQKLVNEARAQYNTENQEYRTMLLNQNNNHMMILIDTMKLALTGMKVTYHFLFIDLQRDAAANDAMQRAEHAKDVENLRAALKNAVEQEKLMVSQEKVVAEKLNKLRLASARLSVLQEQEYRAKYGHGPYENPNGSNQNNNNNNNKHNM
ncbi:MAG: hypothetical protein ACYCUI_16425, partial [Vulcanimicrobiaceae bacterium]